MTICPHCGHSFLPKTAMGLTVGQKRLFDFVRTYIDTHNGVAPSFDEMRLAMDSRSKSCIHRIVKALEDKGLVRTMPRRARAIEVRV